ncbi:hypothetical protein HDR58_05360 [bacterium]|nr:hypothetical protein [bacterium]
MSSFGGMQIPSKIGVDFNTHYNIPDSNLTNKTTLQNNPLYNMTRVLFDGKRTDSLGQSFGDVGAISTNGLRNNPVLGAEDGKNLFTVV